MAKTIKFNLICDGKPIRTLEDLKNNFSVEDVLSYFQNGLLKRWLMVRGFENELNEVNSITSKDEIEIITALVKIFGISNDMAEIEKDTYIFKYTKNREDWLKKCEKAENNQALIIKHYHEEYEALIDKILDNKDNMPLIKATIKEIEENYFELFYMQMMFLFLIFASKAPMAYYVMLMNDKIREYYFMEEINIRRTPSKPENNMTTDEIGDIKYPEPSNFDETKKILGNNLKVFSGNTRGLWKDVEPKGKRFMILHMEDNKLIRAPGSKSMSTEEINGNFVILDGIEYQSNSDTDKLLYLEV